MLLLAEILSFIPVSAQQATGRSFNLSFGTCGTLLFQNDLNRYIKIEVINGQLNSSDNQLLLDSAGGFFKFKPNSTVSLKITYANCTVKVQGDQGNPLRVIDSGTVITSDPSSYTQIIWDITIEPYFPIMFIFGMVGLVAMLGGPLYIINKIKKRQYFVALRNGLIITIVGIALFIGWLWA